MFLVLLMLGFIAVAGVLMFASKPKKERPAGHQRGQALATGSDVAAEIRREKMATRLSIGGVPIPIRVEDRGFLLAGSPGVGKSHAITGMLDVLQRDGHRAVIADPSGIFYSRYAGAGVALFNPYDSRSVVWSPLAEIRSEEDCASMSMSIVPDAPGDAGEWHGFAQTLLESVLAHVWETGGNTGDVLRLASVATAEELSALLPAGPVHAFLHKDAARTLGSIRVILGQSLKPFSALDPTAGGGAFSVRNFIENENGWLFIAYKQTQRNALRPLIAAVIDVASSAVLDLPPATGDREKQRRTWFVLDELSLLGRIGSLLTLLSNGSKHGAAVIAGVQTIAQLRETYGNDQTQTILATLGTWLTLRISDVETSDYMSRALGDEEVRRVVKSGGESGSKGNESASENWSEQYTQQRVVLASELQNLPDLCGYLNIAGPLPACPVRVPVATERPPADEPFVAAERKSRQAPELPDDTDPDTDTDTDDQGDQNPPPATAGAFTL